MKYNGRPPASPATEIKKCVRFALGEAFYRPEQKDGSVKYKELTLDSGYGPIKVRLVAHSPFQKSHYHIDHPAYGKWLGYLTSISKRNGEFGFNIATPKLMEPPKA